MQEQEKKLQRKIIIPRCRILLGHSARADKKIAA
jgi:hypothetical protein